MRRILMPLLALSLTLAACKDEPPTSEAPTGTTDEGDWNDEGPFAGCSFVPVACGYTNTIIEDPSCDVGSLGGFGQDGIYTLHVRTATAGSDAYGFRTMGMRLVTDGGTEEVSGLPLTMKEAASNSLFLAAEASLADGGTLRRTFKGCRVSAPGELLGCYAECRGGQLASRGSFKAVRVVAPAPGEPEASGLSLVSETAVTRGTAADVYVTKGHAYVVSLRGGLYVYDVRDPARPALTRHVYSASDNYWNGVWATGDTLYVASGDRGVLVFDISNPAEPVQVRSVPGGAVDVHTVYVHGNLLLGASADPDGVVLIFDIQDARNPVLLSKFQALDFDVRRSYGPHDMFAFENTLYVNFWGAGYVLADISNPMNPVERGRYRYAHSTSHANAVGRFGDRLIAFEGGEDWGAHLRVLDVTDPANVKRLGEWRLQEHISIHNLVLVGTKLYVSHYQNGVRVLDVSVPEQPRQVAHYHTFRPWDPERGSSFYDGAIGIRVPGDGFVYAVDTSRGLLILKED
jgi:hypothetical protein